MDLRRPRVYRRSNVGFVIIVGGLLLDILLYLSWLFMTIFLAATKQLYEWFSPSVCLSVCPSVIRYARVCNEADDFKERIKVLTDKLIKKGFTINRLKNTIGSIVGLQRNIKDWQCKISPDAGSTNRVHNWHWSSTHTFYQVAEAAGVGCPE